MPVEITVRETLGGLDILAKKLQVAGYLATKDALRDIQKYAIALAPTGTAGNTTNPPGTLKRHIDIEGPYGSKTKWTGKVGPTVESANRWHVNYGGQREFGGDIYAGRFARSITSKAGRAGTAGAPRLFFRRFGQWYSPVKVSQRGAHYLLRGRAFAIPSITRNLFERVTTAVEA